MLSTQKAQKRSYVLLFSCVCYVALLAALLFALTNIISALYIRFLEARDV